ncbi:MAG: glycosyltransferase family 9 protein [Candidatus Sumerlaeia bacterium]
MKKSDPGYIQWVRETLVPDKIRFDCRYYTGYKPCGKADVCEGCALYTPQGRRILIIKLGALGDVLRTTPLLRALRASGKPCHITWVTNPEAEPLFLGQTWVDRVMTFDPRHLLILEQERFDLLLSLDKDAEALALAMSVQAGEKRGFALSSWGTPTVFNDEAVYALQLALNDPLKFYHNQKTYQEVIFDACGFTYHGEEYVLGPTDAARAHAAEVARRAGIAAGTILIGINTGCGSVFLTKQWTVEGFCELIERIIENFPGVQCLLLGGPRERDFNEEILRRLTPLRQPTAGRPYPALADAGCGNTLEQFIGIVDMCPVVVSSDSLAMHLAIGLGKHVVVFFGPTCAQEIDLYGRGAKIVTDFECSPCYLKTCDKNPTCMQALTAESLLGALHPILTSLQSRPPS